MRVLLAGATGLVGAQVLQRLLAEPRCSGVIAPTRRALARTDPKLLNPVLDFAALATVTQGWQVDAVICALGSTMKQAGSREAFRQIDHGYPLVIARAARANGCEVFALNSAAGANPRSLVFYSRVKGELEQDLRALGFASLTLVRPGLIGGDRVERRAGEPASIWPAWCWGGWRRYCRAHGASIRPRGLPTPWWRWYWIRSRACGWLGRRSWCEFWLSLLGLGWFVGAACAAKPGVSERIGLAALAAPTNSSSHKRQARLRPAVTARHPPPAPGR